MKQKWYHYTQWEDFLAGMYNEDKEGREERVQKAMQCLTDEETCYKMMKRVTQEWKIATEQNLTNASINHQAFLGQTACAIYAGIHEDETREAWGRLTTIQRYRANKIADRVYMEWEREYTKNEPNYQMSMF